MQFLESLKEYGCNIDVGLDRLKGKTDFYKRLISKFPEVIEETDEFIDFIAGEKGILKKWLLLGARGWRLDVADELPDRFLEELRDRIHSVNPESVLIGEVWENAADKIAYGTRRKYFRGSQLDSVMNYPVKNAIISFVRDRDAHSLYNTLTEIYSSYPSCVCNALMNILGTHDTERILTVLGTEDVSDFGRPNPVLAASRLSCDKRQEAVRLLKMASVIQYTVFGVPSLFYGDEAGLEGYHDPFCRRPYPWGREDKSLLRYYKKLGKIRRENPVFADGDFEIVAKSAHAIAFSRKNEKGHIIVGANCGTEPFSLCLPSAARDLLSGKQYGRRVTIGAGEVYIWRMKNVSSHDRALEKE